MWSEIAALQRAIQLQRWTKTYLVGNQPILGMPQLRVNYEYGVCLVGTSSYSSPIVNVCGAVTNNDARHEFVMTHEYFHWFQDHFMADMKGNAGTWPESGAFGEGFCTVMPTMLDGSRHRIEKNFYLTEAEDLDYSGNKEDDGNGVLVEGLPVDLYVLTHDQNNGGWSWRILWDFYDNDSGTFGVAEPESNSTREPYGGAAGFTDYGDFDKVGDPEVFHDVVLNYLGGNLVSGNLADDPMSVYYYGVRGELNGLGTTELS